MAREEGLMVGSSSIPKKEKIKEEEEVEEREEMPSAFGSGG